MSNESSFLLRKRGSPGRTEVSEAVSVMHPPRGKVYDCLTESGKCSRGGACKTQNRFGFVLKYCYLHREGKNEFLMNLI